MQQLETNQCPECSGTIIHDYESGEDVCGTCGLVLNNIELNSGPEYKAYTFEETQTRSRTGKPTTLTIHDKGLTTMISGLNMDAHGKALPANQQATVRRLRRWQTRCRINPAEKSLYHAMIALDKYADKLNVPKATREKTAYLLNKALNAGLAKGRTIEGLTAGCLYMACRQTNVLRSLDEIATRCNLRRKQISSCYRLVLKELQAPPPPLTAPTAYINRVSAELEISPQTQQYAFKITQQISTRFSAGKDPRAVAASIIYYACEQTNKYDAKGNLITQKRLAATIGITEVTIRNRYHDLTRTLA
jgi:transcription initiation factor TFIIB